MGQRTGRYQRLRICIRSLDGFRKSLGEDIGSPRPSLTSLPSQNSIGIVKNFTKYPHIWGSDERSIFCTLNIIRLPGLAELKWSETIVPDSIAGDFMFLLPDGIYIMVRSVGRSFPIAERFLVCARIVWRKNWNAARQFGWEHIDYDGG